MDKLKECQKVYEGTIITLIPIPIDDHYDVEMQQILSDKETMKFLLNMIPPEGWTDQKVKSRREMHRKGYDDGSGLTFYIIHNETKALLGTVGLMFINMQSRNAEAGIVVDRRYWRQGVATEAHLMLLTIAFESLGMHRICFQTLVENTPMRKFFEKAGLTMESIQRERVWFSDQWHDGATYVIFEKEWPSTKQALSSRFATSV
mmetsp:Transcript_14061/g.19566  ORF Transcript_14061/g.19566 Transcript_14061/m.19566 type:complete len:204 (-) Transcript_14061:199-810(-)